MKGEVKMSLDNEKQEEIYFAAKIAMEKIISTFNRNGSHLREDTLREVMDAEKEYQGRKKALEGGIDNG